MKIEQNVIKRIALIGSILLFTGIFFYACNRDGNKEEENFRAAENPSEITALKSASGSEPDSVEKDSEKPLKVCVYVCGAVVHPGVYELDCGSRKADALDRAGGFMEDARKDAVNLADTVSDGEMIRFPYLDEEVTVSDETSGAVKSDGRVNINTASENELTFLPGIGESKAKAIVEYRDRNGSFSSTEELMNIPGIKEGTFEGLREFVKTE